ncbi:VOC family protein [Aminobacter anthyllidis]|uniref:VOC family protein n=1 Tax=Aminobacter anthyllidis TaxID=1035067 RepID=UPI002457B515|nr:VOC family protein [Aminobacter anthyllidis]MDH4984566.1 VOC family protein [Aminobacter anthyllidis]
MTKSPSESPRPLDHVVLPTADLALARRRLAALGFNVSPQGTHPFGTINCCVYLSDGTFLEPLAIGDKAAADKAIVEGNEFVARDRLFRDAHGDEGFSAVVFGTDDADSDHSEFVAAGVSAGSRLDFSRPFVDASGKSDQASFRLAFAAQPNAVADAFFFTCQRANAPAVDRSALQAHANGARRVLAVELAAGDVEAAGKLLATVARSKADGAGVPLANARLSIRNVPNAGGVRLETMVFAVDSLAATRALLVEHAIEHDLDGNRLVVPPAPGQGATFIFEDLK